MKKEDVVIEFKPRPSRLNQIFHHCLGSLRAEHGLVEATQSKLAEAGEGRHIAMQTWLVNDPDATTRYLELDMQDRNAVRLWQSQINAMFEIEGKPDAIHIEFGSGKFTELPFEDGTGDADAVLLYNTKRRAYVFDWKGQSEQAAIGEHLQLISYAIGVWKKWKTLIDEVVIVLFQPDFEPQSMTLSKTGLIRWYETIYNMILEAQAKDAPRTPSPAACRFCRAFMTERCPETVKMLVPLQAGSTLAPISLETGAFLTKNWAALETAVKNFKAMMRQDPALAAKYGLTIRKGYMTDYVTETEGAAKLIVDEYQLSMNELIEATKGFSMEKLVTLVCQKTGRPTEEVEAELKKQLREYGYLGSRETAGAVCAASKKK